MAFHVRALRLAERTTSACLRAPHFAFFRVRQLHISPALQSSAVEGWWRQPAPPGGSLCSQTFRFGSLALRTLRPGWVSPGWRLAEGTPAGVHLCTRAAPPEGLKALRATCRRPIVQTGGCKLFQTFNMKTKQNNKKKELQFPLFLREDEPKVKLL